ncbi:zinc-finger of the MIZ type in Nse subunit-domain-containing protein [Umbelopsis sp. PMI_123]|nr:zinc-finger of the MIZ type in Nse subunit-domain-containing protein [Umbelopsis sp. PMI_123]
MPTTSSSSRENADAGDFLSQFVVNIEYTGQILQLLRSNEKIAQHIQNGMQLAIDAACEAEELKMEDKVVALGDNMRKCINLEAKLQHQEETLKQLNSQILTGEQIKNMVDYYNEHKKVFEQRQSQESESARYKQHDAYRDFKQRVWDIHHNDEEMPLSEDENLDEDIIVGRAKQSLKCPLTTVYFENPVMSKQCKHNFSYHAILQLFPRNGQPINCPIPGCSNNISKDDLVQNHLLAKKVEQAKMQETQRSKANKDYHVVTD